MDDKVIKVGQFLIAAVIMVGAVGAAVGINVDVEALKALIASGEARALAVVTAVTLFMPSIPQTFAVLGSDASAEEKVTALGQLALAVVVLLGAIAAAFGITFDVEGLKAIVASWQTRAMMIVGAISTFLPSIPALLGGLFGSDTPVEAKRR